ncbi:exported hypothetical protein [Paraburkholderia piptadeniae]|uniref:Lipoprotein n=2 Tax=Paraburkholderia TaxID=1822464 RepID=A0A7X1NB78_9BURK|nr:MULTISPECIES: hypothetical protein [Paraburkholderia]MPW18768.1 hypothetical protein [Paraburkholderia franconis]SIT48203.1 exported hypothetical protein [Paraburkholderia piptadeniae]
MKKLCAVICGGIVLSGCSWFSHREQASSGIDGLNRTVWAVTDTPHVGTIVKLDIHQDGTASIMKSSDVVVDYVSSSKITERVSDTDKVIDLTGDKGVNLAINLLQLATNFAVTNVSADATTTSSAHFSFKSVHVDQAQTSEGLQRLVQNIDDGTYLLQKARDLFANINDEVRAYREDRTVLRTYYIVAKVFNVGALDIVTSGRNTKSIVLSCTFFTKSCGTLGGHSNATDKQLESGAKPFFVVLVPFYQNAGGTLFLDQNASKTVKAVTG